MAKWTRTDPIGPCGVALDSLRQQIAFLGVEERPRFTEDVRMAIYECAERMGRMTRQMDAGQRGGGISFDEWPFLQTRLCVAACILAWSGKLEELDVEEMEDSHHCGAKAEEVDE